MEDAYEWFSTDIKPFNHKAYVVFKISIHTINEDVLNHNFELKASLETTNLKKDDSAWKTLP